MRRTYRLQIVTQDGLRYDGEVDHVRAPGAHGSFGVLPGHAAMIAELAVGPLYAREPGGLERCFACAGGILEVSHAGVVVLGDAVEERCDIDLDRAATARDRALERLQHRSDRAVNMARAEAALARALNRIKLAPGNV